MGQSDRSQEILNNLEDLLVKEFRSLQSLIALSQKERLLLSKGEADSLMVLVEEKETLLDQMSLLEESRRSMISEAARELDRPAAAPSGNSTLEELTLALEPIIADRLKRLSQGILALVEQTKELNEGNMALAGANLDWVKSAQAFLINLYNPEVGYRPPGMMNNPPIPRLSLGEVDHRA